MKRKWFIAAALLLLSEVAWAQMTPQQQASLPPSDPNSPQYNTVYLPALENAAPPQERWADRWGAFSSASGGMWGGVQDMKSKRQAEKAALARCKAKGGKDCRIDIVYYNQCGAVVSGDGGSGGGRAATEKEAVEIAMESCGEKGGNCELYFMGCSYPVRVN